MQTLTSKPMGASPDPFTEDDTSIPVSAFIKKANQWGQKSVDELVIALIPAYNEARFIGSVVLAVKQFADVVLVIDDGSSDNTAQIAQWAGALVVQHETNKGKGEALNTGFVQSRALFLPSVVVTIDGDWQHLPEELPKVIAPVLKGDADIVIGSRYLQETSEVPVQRVLAHWGFTFLINQFSGTRVTDSQSGYRAFSPRALDAIRFNSHGFGVESEMQFVATDHKLSVVEVPITIRYTDPPKRSVIKHGIKVLNGVLRLISQHRPLLFFSGVGSASIVVGALLEILAIRNYYQTQQLAIGTAILAILLCMIGFVSLCTGIILHSMRAFMLDLLRGAGPRR